MTSIPGNGPNAGSGTDPSPVVDRSKNRLLTAIAALTAIVDVVLAVLANRFFDQPHQIWWVTAVVVAGVIAVSLQVLMVRADTGDLIRSWDKIRKIVAGRVFIAVLSAAVAGGLTYAVVNGHDQPSPNAAGTGPSGPTSPTPTMPATSTPTSASPTTPTPVGRCRNKAGTPGVLAVKPTLSAPDDLTFCPALLNNGQPITGPFGVAGQVLGPASELKQLTIVNQADPATCDALGNKAVTGYFSAEGLTFDTDGSWQFQENLGYDEAVTIARNFMIVEGSPSAIKAIEDSRKKNEDNKDWAGMPSLPAGVVTVGTFRQAPGKYDGKGSPCKNT
jgi:hypothetical protein